MRLSSELDKIIRQNVKDDSAYEVIQNLLADSHPTMETHQPNHLTQLHRIATTHYDRLEDMFEAYLKVGCTVLDIDVGMVSRVSKNAYYVQTCFPQAELATRSVPLPNTFCRFVVADSKTVKFNNISQLDPSPRPDNDWYNDTEHYVGAPIFIDDQLWGTICFYGSTIRSASFAQADIEFVELMALSVSSAMNNRFNKQQRRHAERRYRLIFENIDIPVIIYDVETYDIFDINPTATEFYGYSREEFLELTMVDINMMPPSDIEARIQESQASNLPYTRFPHRLKLGDIREIEEYSNELVIDNRRLRFSIIYDYSEHHAAEEALKHSEANLRAIFDNASQLMFLVDETGSIIAMNRAAIVMMQAINGIPEVVKSDTTLHNYHPQSDRYLISDYVKRALGGESTTHDELVHLTENQPLYLHYRYVPVKTADDQIIGVCVTGQDVTSLKLSEEKLAYERNILRTLIDNLPDAIYIKDAEARLLTANQRYVQMARVKSADEVLGKNDLDLYPKYGEKYYKDDRSVIENGVILNRDEPVILPDDTEGIFETTKIPLKDDDDKIVGLVGVGRDITKQRAIEQGLRDNEEKFNQLITHIPETFWIYDIESQRLIYASDDYEKMFGISLEERHRSVDAFLDRVHIDDRNTVRDGIQRQSLGMEAHYEARFNNLDNPGTHWVNIRIYPIYNADGKVYRVAGIASDVTEEKRAQEAMLEMMAQQERISILSTFFRDASHEFITPLSVIKTSAYLMTKTQDLEKHASHVSVIQEQVRGLSDLVDMLVTMSRLDGGVELTLVAVNINTIVKQFEQTFKDVYPNRADDFKMILRKSIPPVFGNRNYINQATRNLIDNAVRYSQPGSPIHLRTYLDDHHVIIEIEDRGTGISDEELPKIFQRFYRSDVAHSTRGFGLGLPIAQSIVQRHGGEIQVESEVDRGSIFRLLFPMIRVMTP